MSKKNRAVETISDRMWITYDGASKSGTLIRRKADFQWLRSDGTNTTLTDSEVKLVFDLEEKPELSSWHQTHVFGYPVPSIETFKTQERDNLPCFTKKPKSKIYHAAGYYAIKYEHGWTEGFCPRLATLRKYEFMGPFKTEADMQIVIRRRQREDNT